jgi:glucose-6-phosphate 1-epimerase
MSANDIAALNAKFGIDNQIVFKTGAGGLTVAEVTNSYATATIVLQGAHLTRWTPRKQQPVIWLSPVAKFAAGKSIRGGVPICWPWFGPHASDAKLPGHGFARTVPWEVIASKAMQNGATQIAFRLVESDATRAQWPHASPVEFLITVGDTLAMQLITRNTSNAPITIGDALHTYFAVSDIREVYIHGLGQCPYLDKMDGGKRKQQNGPVVISAETDRIYLQSSADCVIEDIPWRRRIRISKYGSNSSIVWNPWLDKANAMGDFGPDGYLHMVCVESANAAEDVVTIAPGAEHRLSVTYHVESLK